MKEMNAAQKILAYLGAYMAPAELASPEQLAKQKMRAKRRTRPMIGRGNYGKNLRAYFDNERFKARAQPA